MMLGSGFGFPPPAPPPAGSSQAKFSRKGLVLEADNNKQLEKWFVALLEGSSSTTSFFAVTDHSYRSSRDRGAQWAARPAPLLAVSRIPRLRQRDLMEEVAAAQSFQVRPVRQLPGSPQERQQLSFSPGARRGATPTGKLRARSAAAPELAGAEQPGGGAPPAAERSRRREATRRLLHSPPWTIGWHRRPQAGSPPRSKVPTAAAREKRSGERPSAPNRRSAPLRLARRGAPRPAPTEPGAPHAPPYIGAVGPRLPGPARSAPRRAHWLRCRPPQPGPGPESAGGAGGDANNEWKLGERGGGVGRGSTPESVGLPPARSSAGTFSRGLRVSNGERERGWGPPRCLRVLCLEGEEGSGLKRRLLHSYTSPASHRGSCVLFLPLLTEEEDFLGVSFSYSFHVKHTRISHELFLKIKWASVISYIKICRVAAWALLFTISFQKLYYEYTQCSC